MTRLTIEDLGWQPAPDAGVALALPRLVLAEPGNLAHIGAWRVIPGDEPGYADPGLDDSTWYEASRINEVGFGFPTWEGESYGGDLWYRARAARPGQGPHAVTLGSPLERRRLTWRVYADGTEVTAGPVEAGMVTVDLPDGDGDVLLAIHLTVAPNFAADQNREREGWRSTVKHCWQHVHTVGAFTTVAAERDGDTLTYPGGITADLRYETAGDLLRQRLTLHGDGPWISHVLLTEQAAAGAEYQAEGAWALWDGRFQAAVHPAAVTYAGETGPVSVSFPGERLTAGRPLVAPDVVIGTDVRALLGKLGRERTPYRIYDPYGWYQISHVNEPKVELSDGMMGDIDGVLDRLSSAGATFDAISLDCGWNDPDDLSRFNPATFADDSASVLASLKRHDLDLILWVSPSDGPRAFRHELGMHNPGLAEAEAGSVTNPWRLCPAAEPWRTRFREALLHHVTVNGATGFKLDGTELYCSADGHGHAPGLHSLHHTSDALIDTFEALIGAGAPFLMLYWGLRSPWWLRWGATLWERDYLVEAAGPSGVPSWNLRLAVACSQDIGQQSCWPTIPAHQQDSLGVWVSSTLWASRQGAAQWEDAQILDVARGSMLNQLWGDLRMAGDERIAFQMRLEDLRRPELLGSGATVGRAWADDVYGYTWSGPAGTWVVLSRPGPTGSVEVAVPAGLGGLHLDYLTDGATARAELAGGTLRVAQSGGSVIALYAGAEGPAAIGAPPPVPTKVTWSAAGENRAEPSGDVAKAAYLGRAPQIATWMKGQSTEELTLERIVPCVPVEDRDLALVERRWRGEVELTVAQECALVTSVTRDGAAWHHDRLHELVELRLEVNGAPVVPAHWPDFPHEQAGSWSSTVDTFTLPPGRHVVEAVVRTVLPDTVEATTHLWIR